MTTLHFKAALLAAATGLLLAACGGGGGGGSGDSPAPAAPAGTDTPPASASANSRGFMAYVASMTHWVFDVMEPVDMDRFAAPTDNTEPEEPWPAPNDA